MGFVDAFDWILDFNVKGNRRNQNPGTYQRSTEYDSTFISFKDTILCTYYNNGKSRYQILLNKGRRRHSDF